MKKMTDNLRLPSHLPQSGADHLLDKYTGLYFGLARLGIRINQSSRINNSISLDIEGMDYLASLEWENGEFILFDCQELLQANPGLITELNHLNIGIG